MTDFNNRRIVKIVFIAAAAVYLGSIWFRPLLAPDEVRYALIAREMLTSGNFAVPTLNGLSYYEKPALGYWLIAGSMKLFGETPFAVRLPSALFTLLTGAVIYFLGLRSGSWKYGLSAALIYWMSGLVFAVGTFVVLDPPFAFFTVAATAAGYCYCTGRSARERWLSLVLCGVFLGCGIMIKGLLAPVLAGSAVTGFLLLKKSYLKLVFAGVFILIFTAVSAAPGVLFMHFAAPDFWYEFIWIEHFRRGVYGSGAGDDRSQPFWFYLPILIGGSLPVLMLAPAGFAAVRKKWKSFFFQDDLTLFCSIAAVIWLLFFSAASAKLGTYILPVFPFMALIFARSLGEAVSDGSLRFADKALQWMCAAVGSAAVLFVIWHFLPFVPVKLKLYSRLELIPVIMGIGLLLLWYNMAYKEKKEFPERKFLYFCIGTAAVMLTSQHVFPQKVLRELAVPGFIRSAVLPRLKPGAVIMADGGCAASTAWTLRRNVPVYIKPGEFRRGLERAGLKAVTPEELPEIIRKAEKSNTQVVVITRSRNRVKEMPAGKTVIRAGRLSAVIFGRI